MVKECGWSVSVSMALGEVEVEVDGEALERVLVGIV